MLSLFVVHTAFAAPQQIQLVYNATRNGQPFATVTETFQQQNGRYRIESVTEGIGVYGLFGKRRLLSEGEVTPQGLRPSHFELQQGDNAKKAVSAEFDWAAKMLSMKSKGQTSSAVLEEGTQDLLSYAYQFMFRPPQGEDVRLPVTTGKKQRVYQYRVAEKEAGVETGAGIFKTVHLANGAADGDENKELWLGVEKNHIVVKISMKDESGARIEQTLSSLHAE
jgi:hypothetical protein